MIPEERKLIICDHVNQQGAVTVQELMEWVDASEATIRRDLNELNKKGLLIKVHGGAVALQSHISSDFNVAEREQINREEKILIARHAASLIKEGDMVYVDAGTTTDLMLDYIDVRLAQSVTFVTNALAHANKLSSLGFSVSLPGGTIKNMTGALVGSECYSSLERFRFSIGFFGANAVTRSYGFTTPDIEEAEIKRIAFSHTRKPYVVADHEKFGKTSSVSFGDFADGEIITAGKIPSKYLKESNVFVVTE